MENHTDTFKSVEPVAQDRATIQIAAVFQEFGMQSSTAYRYAYDRISSAEESPYKGTLRVNPSKRVQMPSTGEGKTVQVLLHHAATRFAPGVPEASALTVAQASNIISISDSTGNVLGFLPQDGACLFYFTGPIYVESTTATAVLHILAMPV